MSRTALVTGGTGLLGREIVRAFDRAGWNVVGTGFSRANGSSIVKLDLLDTKGIEKVLDDVKPDVVIHSAANRSPDACTNTPDAARALNTTATRTLASLTAARDILLVYISTDYVFSGLPGDAPYKPSSTTSPPNTYGLTKRDGEVAVLEETKSTDKGILGVVLRVPLLYGHVDGKDDPSQSAVHPLVDAVWKSQGLKEGEAKVKVDHYAQRYPTACEDVARVCLDISKTYLERKADKSLPSILQFTSEQKMTKFEMCEKLAGILGLPMDGLEAHDPTNDEKLAEGKPKTSRPYDCHLSTQELKDLGINVNAMDFVAWWRREFRAFRH